MTNNMLKISITRDLAIIANRLQSLTGHNQYSNYHRAILILMQSLRSKGWIDALRAYIRADKPFFGICIGMQSLFEGSDESPTFEGLGIIPGRVTRFSSKDDQGAIIRVPQMGWNGVSPIRESVVLEDVKSNDAVRNITMYLLNKLS